MIRKLTAMIALLLVGSAYAGVGQIGFERALRDHMTSRTGKQELRYTEDDFNRLFAHLQPGSIVDLGNMGTFVVEKNLSPELPIIKGKSNGKAMEINGLFVDEDLADQ